jgi:putative transposase
MCTFQRRQYFTSADNVDLVRQQLLLTAQEFDVEIVAYCFMTDHLHVLVAGSAEYSDARRCASLFRRRTGYDFRRLHGRRLWQEGYFDRVLREQDATFDVVSYILANPVRAGLCDDAVSYPYSGSSRYSLEEIATSVAWRPESLG